MVGEISDASTTAGILGNLNTCPQLGPPTHFNKVHRYTNLQTKKRKEKMKTPQLPFKNLKLCVEGLNVAVMHVNEILKLSP